MTKKQRLKQKQEFKKQLQRKQSLAKEMRRLFPGQCKTIKIKMTPWLRHVHREVNKFCAKVEAAHKATAHSKLIFKGTPP